MILLKKKPFKGRVREGARDRGKNIYADADLKNFDIV